METPFYESASRNPGPTCQNPTITKQSADAKQIVIKTNTSSNAIHNISRNNCHANAWVSCFLGDHQTSNFRPPPPRQNKKASPPPPPEAPRRWSIHKSLALRVCQRPGRRGRRWARHGAGIPRGVRTGAGGGGGLGEWGLGGGGSDECSPERSNRCKRTEPQKSHLGVLYVLWPPLAAKGIVTTDYWMHETHSAKFNGMI